MVIMEIRNFSSASAEITDYINKIPNLTCDVGQVLFGQTTTMSGDDYETACKP